jgi:hypothetical protein
MSHLKPADYLEERHKNRRSCGKLTYVTELFQLNYMWHVSRNPGIDSNVSVRRGKKKRGKKQNAYTNSHTVRAVKLNDSTKAIYKVNYITQLSSGL